MKDNQAELMRSLMTHVIAGEAEAVVATCRLGLESGIEARDLLNAGMMAGMAEIGDRFSRGEAFVPEMLIAARAMKAGIKVLEPELVQRPALSAGRVLIGTVAGDLHDIGKNLTALMMESAGFEVTDLGVDVPVARFVSEAMDSGAAAVGISALLTTTMGRMREVVAGLREAGFTGKVIIGGAPVTETYAEEIGADLYGPDAADGARRLKAALAPGARG